MLELPQHGESGWARARFRTASRASLGSLAGAFFAPLLGILLFIAFLIIAAQMVIALVEGFIIMSGGVLLLGFLGSPWTARFGLSYFATLAGAGIKLFMIYIIVAIGGGGIAVTRINDELSKAAMPLLTKTMLQACWPPG